MGRIAIVVSGDNSWDVYVIAKPPSNARRYYCSLFLGSETKFGFKYRVVYHQRKLPPNKPKFITEIEGRDLDVVARMAVDCIAQPGRKFSKFRRK